MIDAVFVALGGLGALRGDPYAAGFDIHARALSGGAAAKQEEHLHDAFAEAEEYASTVARSEMLRFPRSLAGTRSRSPSRKW